jgi:hypothetical protein
MADTVAEPIARDSRSIDVAAPPELPKRGDLQVGGAGYWVVARNCAAGIGLLLGGAVAVFFIWNFLPKVVSVQRGEARLRPEIVHYL